MSDLNEQSPALGENIFRSNISCFTAASWFWFRAWRTDVVCLSVREFENGIDGTYTVGFTV
jgi:hypothetical protein